MRRTAILVLLVILSATGAAQAQRPKKAAAKVPVVAGKTVADWAKALEGKELVQRVGAINALIQAGPEARTAVPALIGTFRDNDATFLHPLAAVALARVGPDAVPALQKALGDKTETVRGGAALALGLIGPAARPAVSALAGRLDDPSPVVRFAAAQALGRVGGQARTALPALRKALGDKDSAVKVESAHALWLIAADKRALPVLESALADGSASVVQSAVAALGEMGSAAKSAGPLLKKLASRETDPVRRIQTAQAWYQVSGGREAVDLVKKGLEDRSGEVRRVAVAALGTMGAEEKAVETLLSLLGDRDPLIRREAACALCDRSVKIEVALRKGLHDADPGVRWWCALALAASNTDLRKVEEEVLRALQQALGRPEEKDTLAAGTRAVPALVEVLKNRPARLRLEAAKALAGLGLDARAAQPALLEALRSDDKRVRRAAADALGQMGAEGLPVLTRLLSNPDARLREGAARALGQMGVAARSALRGLTALLKDADGSVRTQAALALWNIDQDAEKALAVLNQVLKDVDVKDRWEAIDAFGQISVEVRPAIRGMTEVLVNGLKDRDPRVRTYAARWLFRRTRQARLVVPLLHDGVTDRDPLVRLATVETLGELGAEGKIVELMATALQDRDVSVRLAAEEGLARGGAEMVPQLVEALKNKSPRVRAGVARALALIGPGAKAAVKDLLPLSKDPDEGVRESAREALGRIDPARAGGLTPRPVPSGAPPR